MYFLNENYFDLKSGTRLKFIIIVIQEPNIVLFDALKYHPSYMYLYLYAINLIHTLNHILLVQVSLSLTHKVPEKTFNVSYTF